MIKFLLLIAVLYVAAGVVLGMMDAKKTEKEIDWGAGETWIGFLTWPKRFIK